VTLPNILTEVSNLAGQLSESHRRDVFLTLRDEIGVLQEHYPPSRDVSAAAGFPRFGLTDTAIDQLARDEYLVLTDDLRLSIALSELQVAHINLNHMKSQEWFG
jgi:hypothetical protein